MMQQQDRSYPDYGMSAQGGGSEGQSLPDLLRQWAGFLRRRIREIALCTVLGVVAGMVLLLNLETLYESEALLMVEAPARSPIEADRDETDPADAFVEGQIYIIRSTAVLMSVIEDLSLTEDPYFGEAEPSLLGRGIGAVTGLLGLSTPPDVADPLIQTLSPEERRALRMLRENLVVARQGETDIIRLRVTADEADRASEIANAIATTFVVNRESNQLDRASRVSGWLDERLIELQDQLGEAEDQLARFRMDNNLVSGAAGTTMSEQQVTELNGELITTRAELAQSRAAYSRALTVVNSGGSVQSLPEMQDSLVFADLRGQLLDLERREMELGGSSASSARLTALREEKAALNSQIGDEVERILGLMANEIETLETRETLIVEALAEAGGETASAGRLRELERQVDAYTALYERYLENAGLVDESISYLVSGVEIIEPADVPLDPRFPQPKQLLFFSLMLGATGGIVLGMAREAMQSGFMTARQVEQALDLPILASVPELDEYDDPRSIIHEEPMSAYSEAVRTLRLGLSARGRDDAAPVLLLTSAMPGEGKTSLAAALGMSAIAGGLKVLLVDADMRRGGLTVLFDEEGVEGLSELLRDQSWHFDDKSIGRGELDLIPTGRPVASPSDLFAGATIRRYLEAARQSYDLIILDGPPVANMADAPLLTRLADAVAFVVRWNHTPREVARDAVARLGSDAAKIGAVMNAVDLKRVAQYGESYGQYAVYAQPPKPRAVSP